MAKLTFKDGRYYVRLRGKGIDKLLPTGTNKRYIAEQHLRRIEADLLAVKQRLKDEAEFQIKSIDECVRYFFANYPKEKGITKTTVYTYKQALDDFRGAFSNVKRIQDIKRADYPILTNYLKRRYSGTTVNIRLRGIRVFLNYLEETEFIKDRPFKVREIKTDKKLPQYITPEEMDRFYKQIENPKHRATFKTLEYTGMRVGELPGSQRDGDFIRITHSKSKRERIIPIPPQYIPDYDLAVNEPLKRDYISHLFTRYARRAGIKNRSLHSLRHTYALRTLIQTNNIAFVRELLGHSSVTVTEIYTQFPIDYLKQLFANDDKIINVQQMPIN